MKRNVLIAPICMAIALFFFFSAVSFAQQATTSLNGTITDTGGALIPGASVTITRTATGEAHNTTSNAQGAYQFLQLAPGTWTVKVSATGFGDQIKTGNLLVSKPATIDFKMTVGAVTQTVNVSAETETLNTTDATLGNAVPNRTIQNLPMIDRNVPDLLSLQPGVLYLGHAADVGSNTNAGTDSRSGAVNGVRSDQGNITMDGLDDNNQRLGTAFTGVLRETLDSIDEFRVTTGMANSNQGRAAGAQINLVTKSGTNQFHGGLYEYNRNTDTAANDWFNKNAELAEGNPNKPGQYIRNTYGADVGGPIKKQKLFFFGNYEASHLRENEQVIRTTPFASFKQGDLKYTTNSGNVVTLTPPQIKGMDPNCFANGTCPWGGGVDPYMLQVMNEYPTANGTALGDGLNFGSYSFSSPLPENLNTSIARIDWNPVSRHQLFVRGNLQDDTTNGALQYPGQPPSTVLRDNTKGIAAGDTWEITNNLVNDFRYGYTRQGYSDAGQGCGAYVTFRFLSQPTAEACTTTVHVPVQNFIDNMAWTHGNHTLSYGVDLRIITNFSTTNSLSYPTAQVYNEWLSGGGPIAGSGGSLDPAAFGYPAVGDTFATNYDVAATQIAGLVPFIQGQFNFQVQPGGHTGKALPEGAFTPLNFLSHEFEYYIQDQWKLKPNVTLTVGIRHTLLQPPYETHGQQVQPTTNTHQWFTNRWQQARLGITDQPDLVFAPSGKANGKPSYWNMAWNNIAPRVALVIAPNPKTSIRLGAGMYYDHFGEGIVDSFAQFGSFGLATQIANPDGQYTVDKTPRFTGLNNLPPLQGVVIPSTIQYPFTPPNNVNTGLALDWGVDNGIKTPYTMSADLSIQRELPHGFSVEAAYIGTFGRHLLQQLDLAEPLDLVDPKSGQDYFYAGTQLAKAAYAGQNTVQPIPYWEDLFPYLRVGGESATQNIYSNVYQGLAAGGANDSYALIVLDAYCQQSQGGLGCGPFLQPNGNVKTRFYQRQFSGLYAWSSIGNSSYNALQLTARKVTNNGLSFNFSYTYSNSIDMGSDAEKNGAFATGSVGMIINSFNPKLNRGVSSFDVRHLLTGDFVYQLPFGQGKRFGAGVNRGVDALIGGWTLSGITRVSSGLPFTVFGPYTYSTNFVYLSAVVKTGPVKMHRHLVNTLPEAFADPNALSNGISSGSPLRYPYPGEAGNFNIFRGDGYLEQDASLSKVWRTYKAQTLRFAWEVFNVTNTSRFDTNPISSFGGLNTTVTSGGFGIYSSQLVQSRKQQFSLRYDF